MKAKIANKSYNIVDMSGWKSIKGLMFNDMKDIDGALISGNSIWMPFVKRSLTLIFLNKKNKILKVVRACPMTINPKTWKVYSCKDAIKCLEIKQRISPKVGSKIIFS